MALAIPQYQLEDVNSYLRQRRAARGFVTPREERQAWEGYWNTQQERQLESRRLGLAEQRLNIMGQRTDIMKKQMKLEQDTAETQGYFEGLGTLFQGIFVAGYGRQQGWW